MISRLLKAFLISLIIFNAAISLYGALDPFFSTKVSPDGISAIALAHNKVIVCNGSMLQVWDINKRSMDYCINVSNIIDCVSKIEVDNNEMTISSFSRAGIWELRNGSFIRECKCSYAWEDGDYVMANEGGKQTLFPNFKTIGDKERLSKLRRQFGRLFPVSSRGNIIIFGSENGSVKLWNRKDDFCIKTFDHEAEVYYVKIFGDKAVSVAYGFSAKIWDIASGLCLQTLDCEHGCCAFDVRGSYAAAGFANGNIAVWKDDNREHYCDQIVALGGALIPRLNQDSPARVLSPYLLQQIGGYIIPNAWESLPAPAGRVKVLANKASKLTAKKKYCKNSSNDGCIIS